MNWTNTLNDLAGAGMSTEQIADEINRRAGAQLITKSSIARLRTGETDEPRWTVGELLISVHKHCMRRQSRQGRAAA